MRADGKVSNFLGLFCGEIRSLQEVAKNPHDFDGHVHSLSTTSESQFFAVRSVVSFLKKRTTIPGSQVRNIVAVPSFFSNLSISCKTSSG